MNYSIIIYILGWIMNVEAVCMLVPGITALIYREKIRYCLPDHDPGMSGHRCSSGQPQALQKAFYAREGLVTTALSWIVLSIVGAVPFVLSGAIPDPIDAFLRSFPVLPQPVPVSFLIRHRCLTASTSGDAFPTGSAVWGFWYLS